MNWWVPSRWRVMLVLPFTLLAVGIFIVFLFGSNQGYFYRQSWVSSYYLTIAINLSPVVGTAVLAYWSLCHLTSSKWVALSTTCVAFSSVIFIWYYDMVSNGLGMDLFGSMLVFHGMVIFALKGRFWQLTIKSWLALLIGWHVLTLLIPFIALGLLRSGLIRAKHYGEIGLRHLLLKVRMGVAAAVTCRYMVLGIAVASFSILVLVYTELFDLPVLKSMARGFGTDLEHNKVITEQVDWPSFLRNQLIKIGLISIPYALPGYSSAPTWWKGGDPLGVSELQSLFLGIVVVGVCVIGMFFVRYRLLTMTAVFSGACWIILWRYSSSIYGHDILYYICLPLVFLTLIFMVIWRSTSEPLMWFISAISVLIFTFSSFQMSSIGNYGRFSAEFHELDRRIDEVSESSHPIVSDSLDVYLADDRTLVYVRTPCRSEDVSNPFFLHIFPVATEDLPGDRPVFGFDNLDFDFGDRGIIDSQRCATIIELPDYDIASIRTGQFTDDESQNWESIVSDPYNIIFPELNLRIDRTVTSREPVVRDFFDVYLADDRTLVYVRTPCRSEDVSNPFFLHIFPVATEDLPGDRPVFGFDNLDFDFGDRGIIDSQRCATIIELPDYDIASIRTGQFTDDESQNWMGEFDLAGG